MGAELRGQMAAAGPGRGHVRAAHADREQVLEVLKVAFVQGRLTKDEFETRVSQTFASRTYAELAVVTADIPAGLTRAAPQRRPRRQAPGLLTPRQALAWSAGLSIATVVLMSALLIGNGQLTYLAVSSVCAAAFIMVAQTLYSRQQRRSGGSSRPARALGGTCVR